MKRTFTQTISAWVVLALAVMLVVPAAASCAAGTKAAGRPSVGALREAFRTPPDSVKPGVYWYWLSDNISAEGVRRDLEAMASVGIGRAYIGNIGLDEVPYGKVKLFSNEWWDVVRTALRTAGELGIEIGIFNSPGWSQSGGPWVTPDRAMRYMATAEFHASGPERLNVDMTVPYEHFQDLAVLAFPEPMNEEPGVTGANSRISANVPIAGLGNLIDRSLRTETVLPSGVPPQSALEIDIEMDRPLSARSLTLYPIHKPFRIECELQAHEMGSFRTIKQFEVDRSISWLSLGFLPYGPVCVSFPAVTSTRFRLVLRNMSRNPFMGLDSTVGGFTEIELSGRPRVDRYVEKQLGKMVQGVAPQWDAYKWPPQAEPESRSQCVDPSRVINVSRYLSSDGILHWEAPEGSWVLLRAGMVPTGITNAPATPEGRGLEIDKMSKEGIRLHFDAFIGRILDTIPAGDRRAFKYVIADSYETGSENWTDGFAEFFRKQYGYDPLPWLPVLGGTIVGTAGQSNRFLWDVRRLVADLIASNYVGELRKVSNEHGLALWLENYGTWGFPSEFLKYGGQSDELSGEFWADGFFGIGPIELHAASSAAHIYGKQKVWSESWTSGDKPFRRHPALLKKLGDWSFTQGVNSTLLHVYISQPYEDRHPGINAGFGTEFNRFNTWFGKSRVFIDYLRRCNFMLQQGRPVVDVAYLIGEDAPVMTGTVEPDLPRGYSFDFINAEVIETRLSVKDGKLALPEGLSYSILVLPPLETMTPRLLRRIAGLVKEGAVILGPRPLRSPSMQDFPAADNEVRRLADDLWGAEDGRSPTCRKFGKGMVLRGVDMQTALNMAGAAPDFSLTGHDSVLYVHRKLGDANIYFVSNQTERVVSITPRFRVRGKKPEFWDAVSGETRFLPLFLEDETGTSVPLTLEERQSGFIVFGVSQKRSSPGSSARNFPKTRSLCEIAGHWHVTFDPGARGPTDPLVSDTLEDWTSRGDNDICYYSGSAVYRTTFWLNSLPKGERIVLDLGKFSAIAYVRINGVDAGGVWTSPPQLEVTANLRVGENQLEIEVTNTWANRLIGDLQLPPAERRTWVVVNSYTSESALEPSGLLGPVRLLALEYHN